MTALETALRPPLSARLRALPVIAAALLCRAGGTWPDWCTGVALQPSRAHAWVEAEGRPIGEDEQDIALLVTAMRVTRREG
ncbi:lasso peptide biosynthesis B2 protein [Nocardiopsis composta]|uniref:Microcin J25-processing protein McjB C-terminal domain-containing protein n=1 Tax=Nocardiopsis composta TaxID=157465 RepID=A0A7W8VBK6_9ACTN|nr:lasso peptide biosynthesis B2 protein [Nocardiopsis composta]MBB5429984.1 hypothetical protein [Nocardiopsis composta]